MNNSIHKAKTIANVLYFNKKSRHSTFNTCTRQHYLKGDNTTVWTAFLRDMTTGRSTWFVHMKMKNWRIVWLIWVICQQVLEHMIGKKWKNYRYSLKCCISIYLTRNSQLWASVWWINRTQSIRLYRECLYERNLERQYGEMLTNNHAWGLWYRGN